MWQQKVSNFSQSTFVFIENFLQSIISLIKILVLSRFKLKVPVRTKENCIILGNGPSLVDSINQNISKFKNYDLFCVNNFAGSEYYESLKPKNYVILDGAFFNDYLISIRPDIQKTISSLIDKTQWPLQVHLPVSSQNSSLVRIHLAKNRHIKFSFFNYTVINGFEFFKSKMIDWNLGFPKCNNILGAALVRTINMQYRKIHIIGADHTWVFNIEVNNKNELLLNQKHFYDTDTSRHLKVMHPTIGNIFTIGDFFKSQAIAFSLYYFLEKYSKTKNIKITNNSNISLIDAFEREQLIP